MGTQPILGIAEETLEFIFEAAKDAHPREFLGLLETTRATELDWNERGKIITDVLIIPGTSSDERSATFRSDMVPTGSGTVGSVHSHPNGVVRPSDTDRNTFRKGAVNIIVGAPYDRQTWQAYDRNGEEISLDVLAVTLPDPESFFDFTQADLDRERRKR